MQTKLKHVMTRLEQKQASRYPELVEGRRSPFKFPSTSSGYLNFLHSPIFSLHTLVTWILILCLLSSLITGLITHLAQAAEESVGFQAIMQPRVYQADIKLADYYVSEKLDGVRARWDGKQLSSRNGITFAAPSWFTRGFPDHIMDGELWIARGKYQQVVSIVRRKEPHAGWKQVKFMIFDLPQAGLTFAQRWQQMQTMMQTIKQKAEAASSTLYLNIIPQLRFADQQQFMQHFNTTVEQGGVGLILHRASALYRDGRSHDLLKLKPFYDMEAEVIGYRPGKNGFAGLVGSLKVRLENGTAFHIGSGLTLAERADPPAIGSRISFRYQGFTDRGIPRFPVFLRVRRD